MSSEWAKNLADRKKGVIENKRLQQEKDLSDRNLLNAYAPRMWAELQEAAQDLVRQLNEEMGREHISFQSIPGANALKLQVGTSVYAMDFHAPSWVLIVHGSIYKLIVVEGNGVVWTKDERSNGSRLTSQQIAQNEISRIFMLP
jgi:hypothetical protein